MVTVILNAIKIACHSGGCYEVNISEKPGEDILPHAISSVTRPLLVPGHAV